MKKGVISLVPVLVVFFSLAAFLGVMYFALPNTESAKTNSDNTPQSTNSIDLNENTNSTESTNSNTVNNENQNTNDSSNANVQVDPMRDWPTYTNDSYKFSFRYPTTWKVTEGSVQYGNSRFIHIQAAPSESESDTITGDSFGVTIFLMKIDETDPVRNFSSWTNYPVTMSSGAPITIAGIQGTLLQNIPAANPYTAAIIDHEGVAYELQQGKNLETWNKIIGTFIFADGNVDLEKTNPIKTVKNISNKINWPGEGGLRTVSVMGDKALLGGGKYLYLYNGSTVTDISGSIPVAQPADNTWSLLVGHISNNGSYWLVPIIRTFETSYLFKFDGKNWTDISPQLDAAVPRWPSVGVSAAWNGSYWLMTVHAGKVAKYDGQTFTDLTSQVPTISETGSLGVPVWNGSYFLFNGTASGNHGKFYRYDGVAFSVVSGLDKNTYAMSAGWNGSHWLFSGYNNQHLLKYNGTTFTDLGFPQHQSTSATWLKSIWIVGNAFFDEKKLDITTPFNTGYRVNAISIGTKYGLMLGENGAVYRFDF